MAKNGYSVILRASLRTLVLAIVLVPYARAMKKSVLHYFTGPPDGRTPQATLIADTLGNLYGTTAGGGTSGWGTVFELVPNKDGSWSEAVLYSFMGGADGASPESRLIFDAAGNLYGTTLWGGSTECNDGQGCGLVFELMPNLDGSWSKTTIHGFTGGDGANPAAGVTFDTVGNIYGTVESYGAYGKGAVFELKPNADDTWKETTLYSFMGGKDGELPEAPLVFDAAGSLYGTAYGGGGGNCAVGCGVVFKLSPKGDGSWTGSLVHSFTGGKDGAGPTSGTGLTIDSRGRLYGATYQGGIAGCGSSGEGCGVIFMLTSTPGSQWKETVLYRFQNLKGWWPNGDLAFDAAGNVYGTTQNNGFYMRGTVFRLSLLGGGGVVYTTLHVFNGQDGYTPFAGVLVDPAGNLFCATGGGGPERAGGVFEISQ